MLRRQLVVQEEVLEEVERAKESVEVDLAFEDCFAGGEHFGCFRVQSRK